MTGASVPLVLSRRDAMQVRLEVAHSKANVKRVVLRHDAVIGRSAECSLRIASSLVSRQHCALTLKDGVVYVRDLQSSNGTFLNGTPLKAHEDVLIPPGAELSVGGVRFYVRYDSAQAVAGPGSTVDMPGKEPADSSTTAEWKVKDVVAAAGAGAVAAADAALAVPPTEPAEAEPEAVDLEEAEPAIAETEPPFQMPTAPVMPMRVAMPFEVPADPMATPSVVPANVPAAAPDEEVVASKGDEIDTVMVESEGPSETETIDAGSFRFEEPAESFAAATEESEEAEVDAAGDKKEKKGLRSLFSLFGRKKMPHLEETASADLAGTADEPALPFASAGPAPDDTVSEDVTAEALPADLAAAADSEIPAAVPVSDDDTIPVELLAAAEEAAAEPEPVGEIPADELQLAEEDPEEAGFNDFLKQIGQQ